MGLVEYIHPALAEFQYQHFTTKALIVTSSFFFFISVFVVSATLSSATRTYSALRSKEKMFWNLAIARAVYGIFATIFSTWAIFFDKSLEKNIVFSKTPTTYFTLTVTLGFFIFECSAMVISDFLYKKGSILLNIHHWVSLAGFCSILLTDSTHYFGAKALLLEMTSPFSCLCWILLKAGKAHTLVWKINQFVLVHAFHLRSVLEFYLWYLTYKNWDQIWKNMPLSIFLIFYGGIFLSTFVLTPYWTYKKSQQMITPIDWNFEDSNKELDKTKLDNITASKVE